MKKAFFLLIVGVLAASLVGCNRGWPGCFGRGLFYRDPGNYETYYEPCDECGSYHGDTNAEWVPVDPENLPPRPTQAPAKATDASKDA